MSKFFHLQRQGILVSCLIRISRRSLTSTTFAKRSTFTWEESHQYGGICQPRPSFSLYVFVLSQLDYGNALLYGLPASRLTKLQRVQNAAARLIHQIRRRDSETPDLRSLHWLRVSQRIEFKIAVMVFSCLIGIAPTYLVDLIHLYRAGRDTRQSAIITIAVPRSSTKTFGDRAFFVQLLLVFGMPCR